MEFSQYVLNFMESKGVTSYKLAKATGISESTFSKWRRNPTSKIDADILNKIAVFFDVSVDELIGATKKTPSTEAKGEFLEFEELLKQLTPEQFNLVLERARGYAELNQMQKQKEKSSDLL